MFQPVPLRDGRGAATGKSAPTILLGAKLTDANLAFADVSQALTDPGVVVAEEPVRKVARH